MVGSWLGSCCCGSVLPLEPISSSKGLSVSYPVERVADKSGRGLTCVENTKCCVLVKKTYTLLCCIPFVVGMLSEMEQQTLPGWLQGCAGRGRYGRHCQELVGTCLWTILPFSSRKQSWDLISSQLLSSSEQFAFVYACVVEGLSLVCVPVDKI